MDRMASADRMDSRSRVCVLAVRRSRAERSNARAITRPRRRNEWRSAMVGLACRQPSRAAGHGPGQDDPKASGVDGILVLVASSIGVGSITIGAGPPSTSEFVTRLPLGSAAPPDGGVPVDDHALDAVPTALPPTMCPLPISQ